ncbi:MAG: LacI family transcriptional regulator [candidate division KSB1 bacterium]|nr:LacI family transcriptional regulator [candidate division KSB1 bacterium]
MNATIKDVAKRAGVSISTVSLVLNRKGSVSKETELKVLQAVEELNFHPQRTARGLVTKQTGNFGFILSSDHFSQAEPFYTKIFLGTEFEARSHDYYILLTTVEPSVSAKTMPRFLLERNVDGVILAGAVPRELVDYLDKIALPFVLVDYYFAERNDSVVLMDNASGIRQALDHLLGLGHKEFAFIGGDMRHPSMQKRCRTFRAYLEEKGIVLNEAAIECDDERSGPEAGFAAANRLLDKGLSVTAIVAANDAMAVGVLRACRDRKLRIPEDIAVTGFDNVESSITARPTLTTIHVPKEEMGAAAVRHLVDLIRGEQSLGMRIIMPVRLIPRESTLGAKSGT